MKKIFIFSFLLIITTTTFCQQNNPSPTLTKQDYLSKSKKQKTTAYILLGGGAVLVAGSVLWVAQDLYTESPGPYILFFAGSFSMLGSIPLFIAAKRNKRTGLSLSFINQKIASFQKSSFAYQTIPSLKLKIGF